MSNDISRVYLFLSQYKGADGEDWFDAADGCSSDYQEDGVLLKCEFRTFMKNNFEAWNGETSNLDDLINRFWSQFDTNQSNNIITGTNYKDCNAVKKDSDEYKNFQTVQYYTALNELCANVSACITEALKVSGVDAEDWCVDIASSLANALKDYIAAGGAPTVDGLLGNADFKEALNNTIKKEVRSKMTDAKFEGLKDKPFAEFYNHIEDKELQSRLDSALQGLTVDYDINNPDKFKESLKSTVLAVNSTISDYLAIANIDNTKEYNSGLGGKIENGKLNSIQLAVLKAKLYNDSNIKPEWKKEGTFYRDLLDKAAEIFFDSTFKDKNYTMFDDLKQAVSYENFESSDAGLDFLAGVKLYDSYKEPSNTDNFGYLPSAIGNKITNSNKRNKTPYNDILREVLIENFDKLNDLLTADEKPADAIKELLATEIILRAEEFLTNTDIISSDDLYYIYQISANAADNLTNKEEAKSAHYKYAINFCKRISAISDNHKSIVNYYTNSNPATFFEGLDSEMTKTVIKNIYDAVKKEENSEKNSTPTTPTTPSGPQ